MRAIKDIRLKHYNYSIDGYYFVTIITDERRNFFKEKQSLIEQELRDIEKSVEGFTLDYFVIMPNHVHMIIVLRSCNLKLGEVVRRFKAKVSKELGQGVWQPNYYEHVIRTDKALDKIREYIKFNPELELLRFERFYK